LTDLDSLGKKFVICKGGMPGIGNYDTRTYDKGNKEQRGKPGEEKELVISVLR
jgi:GTPase involved in cell partitioning and DNA repair